MIRASFGILTTFVMIDIIFAAGNGTKNIPIRFMNVSVERVGPNTLLIEWTSPRLEDVNTTIQSRQSGENDWKNSFINSTTASHRYYLVVADYCLSYEIRLFVSYGENGKQEYYVSETAIVNSPRIPTHLEPIKPIITKNEYDNRTGTIYLEFVVQNDNSSFWQWDLRNVTADIHVVECGIDGGSGDDTFFASVPPVVLSSNGTGTVRFPKPYVSIVQSGHSCRIMVSIRKPTAICGQPVKVDGGLLDSALLVDMSCKTTSNLRCAAGQEGKKVPSPRCNPRLVDASQISTLEENQSTAVQLRLRWDFNGNESANSAIPERIIIRYGYTDAPTDSDPLFALLVPMHEISRYEVSGRLNNVTINVNASTPELNPHSTNAQRFYRLSICAVYGTADEQKINWAIIPTFAVRVAAENNGRNAQNQCRCHGGSSSSTETIAGSSTARPPAVVSSPSQEAENYWSKVAPLLTVFTMMTIINIALVMISCCYYKRARNLRALK